MSEQETQDPSRNPLLKLMFQPFKPLKWGITQLLGLHPRLICDTPLGLVRKVYDL